MARLRLLLTLVFLTLVVPAIASAQPCPWTINPTASQSVFDRLKALPPTTEGCALTGQSSEPSRMLQHWRHASETFELTWTPRACTQGDDPRIVPLNLRPLQTACPQFAQTLQEVVDGRDWPRADKPVPRDNPRQYGREYHIVMAAAALEVLLALGLLLWLVLAARQVVKLPEPLR